jgi:putative aminopeptidase FrvX
MDTKQRLIEVLSVPSFSGKESQMTKYLLNYCEKNNLSAYSDEYGNVYVTKGIADYYPCVVSHIDTVHPITEMEIRDAGDVLFAMTPDGLRTGIGGDDKAGVFVCLEMLMETDVLKAAFFVAEEVGCLGSYLSDKKFFENVGYAIQFDAPYDNWISITSDGVQLFEIDSEFYKKIEPIFETDMRGYSRKCLGNHPYTDVSALKSLYEFACINYSVGYERMHSPHEIVIVSNVLKCLEMAKKMVKSLGNTKYEYLGNRFISEGYIDRVKRRMVQMML